MRTLVLTGLAVGVLAGAALAAHSARAEAITWRLHANTVEQRPESQQVKKLAEAITQETGGRIKIELFFGGALGIKPEDTLRAMRTGQVEMSVLYAGYFGRDAPDLAQALVQGVVLSQKEAEAVLPTLQGIYEDYYKKWNAVVVGWAISPVYDISVFCKEPINTLAGLKGKKLRVWAKDQVETFRRLGVAAQIIPQGDLYVALQTGVLDCAVYVVAVAKTISLQEVTKHAAPLHVYSTLPSAVAVSTKAWEPLPADLQAAVKRAGETAWREALKTMDGSPAEEKARKELAEQNGLKMLPPFSATDRAAFAEAAAAVWAEQAKAVGRDAPKYRELVLKALEQARR